MEQRQRAFTVRLFNLLAIAGAVVPLITIGPWFLANGLDLPRFIAELFASRVSAFFAWDVLISAVAVVLAALIWPGLPRGQRALVIAGTLLIGVSCGLPLMLAAQVRTGYVR